MISGRQSRRSEYRYHTAVPTPQTSTQEHASARRAMAERQLSDRKLLLQPTPQVHTSMPSGRQSTRNKRATSESERRQLSVRRAVRGHNKKSIMPRAEHSSTNEYRYHTLLLRGTIVNRTYCRHKNLYISLFLLTIFGPINYGPPE